MAHDLYKEIKNVLRSIDIQGDVEFTTPPKPEMGDIAFPVFGIAKELKKNPVEVAKEIQEKLVASSATRRGGGQLDTIEKVQAFGPYVNFWLNAKTLAGVTLSEVKNEKSDFGVHTLGEGKKVMVEFAHPNTHKAFHIGHLRNIMTGESIVRLLENVGYKVIRANYQGDVGLHIAKCLWGIHELMDEFEKIKTAESVHERVTFLGRAYAYGAGKFEESEEVQKQVQVYNEKIYSASPDIAEIYTTTRQWSLEYFNHIYKRVGSHFDRLYFESEVFKRGTEIVLENLKKGIFRESEGAIIFEGSKRGLHDRVFINSKGFPTYEGKEMGLAELELGEFKPDKVVHVTGREQAEYFKVVFKAIEEIFTHEAEREEHITYGWVNLKSGKMSARKGQVVLGEWLLDEVGKSIAEIMKENSAPNQNDLIEKISVAAVKYAFLKTGVQNDIKFDFDESVSLSGDSGPYLLYIVARIKSILRKAEVAGVKWTNSVETLSEVTDPEKQLCLHILGFSDTTRTAAENFDPSKIAHYLLELAQKFNNFYHACPVLTAPEETKVFRLQLIEAVLPVMERGLYLLGIETVEEM